MSKEQKIDFQELMERINNFDINEIDWENMGSWPLYGKIVFAAIVSVAILVAGYWFVIKPKQEQLSSAVQQESTLKKDFERKAFKVANLDQYKTQMDEMEESFGTLLKQLPRDTEVPGLIDDISLAAINSGLELKLINPRDYVQTEFYTELPIEVEVEGGYHELASFVSSVASLPRIVTLHDFSIERAKSKSSNRLLMKIKAKTYKYNEDQ